MPRRSARIARALHGVADNVPVLEDTKEEPLADKPATNKKRKRPATTKAPTTKNGDDKKKEEKKKKSSTKKKKKSKATTTTTPTSGCLPRSRELEIQNENVSIQYVLGIDEAGRGPLAGPVVAAAVWAPLDIEGVHDSKQITKEDQREALYEQIVAMKDVQWAVSIIDAARIDEINILQATLEGMRLAAAAIVNPNKILSIPRVKEASVDQQGCYIVCSSQNEHARDAKQSATSNNRRPSKSTAKKAKKALEEQHNIDNTFYALVDGNKVPNEMPCPAEFIIKGDSKEYCIAAASILAKVTRDRLMHGYAQLYPQFNLGQHKGYGTKEHMKAVMDHGASPIHRRTFAPLKHMEFDKDGNIVQDNG